MPVYNVALTEVSPEETRRYAGLARAKDFDEEKIRAVCDEALLLIEPKGMWQE